MRNEGARDVDEELIDVRKLPVFQSSKNINTYERNVGTGIVSKQLVV
jgi:hypothetical protein